MLMVESRFGRFGENTNSCACNLREDIKKEGLAPLAKGEPLVPRLIALL